jgi:hypothetical protein
MARFFTLRQAEQLLPEVERAIREAIASKQRHETSAATLEEETKRLMLLGGVRVDHARFLAERANRDGAARRFNELIEEIQSQGVQIKDLEIGLIDFPTLFRGQEVYLCWKLGEDKIRFWHGIHEGFRGRKAIDQDFLDNHSNS